MSRQCNLLMVTAENNNKYYNMIEESGEIHVEYGRVGAKPQHATYPLYKWESLKASKEKKGYKEITSYKCESTDATFCFDNKEVENIVNILISKARNKIADNYNVSYKDVTQAQVDEAQNVLNSILEYRTKRVEVEELNKRLLNLYTIVPRKMDNVRHHLLDSFDTSRLKEIITNEQDLLDNMATQVQQNRTQINDGEEKQNILEVAGLTIEPISKKEEKIILEKLGNNKSQFKRAFKVINKNTQKKFDKCIKNADNKTTELFWHGSRTENWWSIISTGLMIRPSGVVTTGSMFGNGIYFANKAQKSIGYTSLSSSYWARGNDSKAYLALYEVHTGNQHHIKRHDSSCYDLCYKKMQQFGTDSVYAHGGIDLRNDEFIIYTPEQCTVKYLVEIGQ